MAIASQYITDAQFEAVLESLNIVGKSEDEKQEILDRAVGDLEGDLCERYVVPLIERSGADYSAAPQFARNKVVNALKAKIRAIIGLDNARNLVIESTQRYVDVHGADYKTHIKVLLDPLKQFGFRLQPQAEGAVEPMQSIGLARADHEVQFEDDPWV